MNLNKMHYPIKSFEAISAIVNEALSTIDLNKQPSGLYEPIAYTINLGGKRIRPALTLMAFNLFHDDVSQAVMPALGIEFFHNFTLLHDDIMDKALVRRGQPTVHVKWDENTAILSGDLMQIIAYELMRQAPEKALQDVMQLFNATAIQVCEGQQYDMEYESREDVTPEEYIEMIRLKTAVLLACALKIGAIIGGASKQDAQYLYDFGIHIGLAFQLKDDLLDVYGSPETFGKQLGGDILCNKKTYLLIYAKKLASGELQKSLNHWLTVEKTNPNEKIAAVTDIYNQLNVKKICEDAMDFYFSEAIAILDKVGVKKDKKQALRNLAENLMHRND